MCAMVFTQQQKIKIIKFWYESKSYIEVHRSFYREFNVHTCDGPKKNAIKRIVKHFEDKGTVRNTNIGVNSAGAGGRRPPGSDTEGGEICLAPSVFVKCCTDKLK